MYLKSFKVNDFRKWGRKNNVINFVDSKLEEGEIEIASASTLIVGKNNSGKTTITKALEKNIKDKHFDASDFNFNYLHRLLNQYKKNHFNNKPLLSFEIVIGIDENNMDDLVTNFIPFINIENVNQGNEEKDFTIVIKYELKESENFKIKIQELLDKYSDPAKEKILFIKFMDLIDLMEFEFNYYDSNNTKIEKSKFQIEKLINIETISANKIIDDKSLSRTFSKIIKYRYESQEHDLEDKIDDINEDITSKVKDFNGDTVNSVLHEIEDNNKFEVFLSSNLTFDKLMQNLIKYEYIEENLHIPESQFGLGYANLMSIIGQLIEYIEKYPEDEKHSKLNLICIEEPEAFMHPQMQELFIKNINKAISKLLDGSRKKINSQLIITTHSSHILNSKVHESNSFNNINYIMTKDNLSNVVNLSDNIIVNDVDPVKKGKDLKFIKKHIKFKVSELFFADAIIFVEGITEETLLSYYISRNENLNKKYITVFNINGAHGLVYHNLIKLLEIPTIVITDLDIKRTQEEIEKTKENIFEQIRSLDNRSTTNQTIKKYNNDNDDISNIPSMFEDENLYITFQSEQKEGYYATSLEEALILNNYNNEILNNAIKEVKPGIYNEIVGDPIDKTRLISNSYKLQNKLSKSKSDFANTLLYHLSTLDDEDDIPLLPDYIVNALDWLQNRLAGA